MVVGQKVHCRGDRAVPAAENDGVVTLQDRLPDRLWEASWVAKGVARSDCNAQGREELRSFIESLLPSARTRVHYEGRALHRKDYTPIGHERLKFDAALTGLYRSLGTLPAGRGRVLYE